jgi:hypothetical protein
MSDVVISQEAVIKDLELQWSDHFHMRDQSWKALQNCVLTFVGLVGLDVSDKIENWLVAVAYMMTMFLAFLGMQVVSHHRVRQKQKFDTIKILEDRLGLLQVKAEILDRNPPRKHLDTGSLIWYGQACIFYVCEFALITHVFLSDFPLANELVSNITALLQYAVIR